MRSALTFFLLMTVATFSAACSITGSRVAEDTLKEQVDRLTGLRFRCGALGSRICLDLLKEGCSLVLEDLGTLPREAGESLVLQVGQRATPVQSPTDLVGCVELKDEQDVLEYLRFFSSLWTVHLFERKTLELHKSHNRKCPGICIFPQVWQGLGLLEPNVSRLDDGGFEVIRTVIKPIPYPYDVTVFRVIERVTRLGEVVEVSSVPVKVPEEVRWSVGFPGYL